VSSTKIRICTEPDCKNVQTTKGYCRLHYLKNWKMLKDEARRKASERLNRYVEGICKKFPDRYLEVIRKDIREKSSFDDGSGETMTHDEVEGILEDLGYRDDESLDRILTQIKIDKDFS